MEIQYRVATLNDVDQAFALSEKSFGQGLSEVERMMEMWKTRWRKEAITHYFKTGWSFVATRGNEFCGYFMAQPFIHFRGQTQSVWVEHLESSESDIRQGLIEIVVRIAREKHIQRVLFPNEIGSELGLWNPQVVDEKFLEVKTTKG